MGRPSNFYTTDPATINIHSVHAMKPITAKAAVPRRGTIGCETTPPIATSEVTKSHGAIAKIEEEDSIAHIPMR